MSPNGDSWVESNNYFVCTLGQAAELNAAKPHGYKTITEFLEEKNATVPDDPAVGFPIVADAQEQWDYEVLSFGDLHRGSLMFAELLKGEVVENDKRPTNSPQCTVALLCPSSPLFLFAWLGLIKLGCSVLLIAPQCPPSAIVHLCKACDVSLLFYDETYEKLALESASAATGNVTSVRLPFIDSAVDLYDFVTAEHTEDIEIEPLRHVSEIDVAYLHHTSGTSTGLPKPIPQTHRAAVSVLPTFPNGGEKASFTTTPLYHGGIADCFRAWSSEALIWLFPGKEVPITAENVLLSLRCAEEAARNGEPSVKYFSSVPYVLQMLLDNAKGLDVLSNMDIVGVGGAALPEAVGDDLVQKGVNLISRFGSAECGFLMSSHREYEADKAWQYLRSTSGAKALAFEKQEHGLFELIVLPGWPHMAKQNREDGSFVTADLFIPHPSIQNAWKYHSRSDSQLTLVTGKKFDPSPLESEIATSPLLQDVLVFGNGCQYPGALLFRSPAAERLSDSELVEELWPVIEKVNKNGQAHTRLSKPMLVVVPGGTAGLKKSSKGTVLRQVAEQSYNDLIENAYLGFQQDDDLLQGISSISIADGDFPEFLTQIVQKELGHSENLHGDADLFSLGLDSVGCIRVRANLQKILPSGSSALPLNVVYDCGTINRLSNYLVELRNGRSSTVDDEILLMRQLVTEHSNYPNLVSKDSPIIDAKPPDDIKPTGEVVVLTGATGALGAHILDQLRSDPSVSQIYCLVRAADATAAFERVSKSLAFRKRRPLDPSDCKVLCVTAKLGKPKLGLTDDMYTLLAERTTLIIHAAWAVNFSMRLRSFIPDHIIGLRNLLDLSLQSPQTTPPRFLFCSSTASVLGDTAKSAIPESASRDPSDASPLGYSRSKWVAERICEQAHLQTRLSGRIAILRIGQLCGDTENGVWNVSEAWPLMLSTVHATGSMPALVHEHLGWLPVDVAACAVLQIAGEQTKAKSDDVPVYHLINYNTIPTWMEMLEWLKKFHGTFEIVVPSRWVEQLEGLSGLHKDHPAKKLLGLWKAAYCEKGGDSVPIEVHFDMDKTKAAAPILKDLAPIMEEHFGKMWKWIGDEMISKSGLPTT